MDDRRAQPKLLHRPRQQRYVWQAFSHKFGGFSVVAALYQGSCYYFGNPQPEKSPSPRRSSSDPLASGGPQLLEEDIASYSTGRPRSANSSSMALADRRRSERKWLGTDQSWIERLWGVMNAIARALSVQDLADVAAYFAGRADGLPPVAGEGIPKADGACGKATRQFALSLPAIQDAASHSIPEPSTSHPAQLVMAPAPTSSEPLHCKASTPLTLNANLRLSHRARGRTTSTSRCAQLQAN